ncbi:MULTISPECIES: hypothetical protein [Bradyrhizobium]|uniref:hypothetical protein n=1 Tax=Bradyrhizobium TaxID=374 RepID=UPI001CD65373|nr:MULTISPECIES: hypothetical protein [Bradyrhizobium]MCA1428959.1 hypothetical protein [Bradyrhizobium sp. NBAIM16]MCA1503849.1 hypothetical protein [Bradyrhizobium sp. NBAIM02]MCA1529214.1 hypothetical protein [Bradyrhizobium yuanmingense]
MLCNHGLYDIAKDFQPALSATIALVAAGVAFIVGMAKINVDRRAAAFQRVSSQLGVCLRLRSRAGHLDDVAKTLTAWLAKGEPDPDKLEQVLKAWPSASELDEAWKVVESMPTKAMDDFETLLYCHRGMAAYASEQRAVWLDKNRPSAVKNLCTNLSTSYTQLEKHLNNEINTLETERENLRRQL